MGELLDKVKGRLKQIEGAVTGNPSKQAVGVIQEKKGDLKETVENIKHDIRHPK